MPSRGCRLGGRPEERCRTVGFPPNTGDIVRLARTALFAAVCVVTSALGHALMSGEVLPWWAIGLALSGAVPGGWWLTGRERAAPTVVGATVAAQMLLHLLFGFATRLACLANAAGGTAGAGWDSGMGGMTFSHAGMAMHHEGAATVPGGTAVSSGPSVVSAVLHGGSGMFLAHVLAAVVCGLWLWRGEVAVHRTGRALAAVLFAPLHRVFRAFFHTPRENGASSWRTVVDGEECRRPAPSTLRHVVVRRGPPPGRSAARRLSPGRLLAVRP